MKEKLEQIKAEALRQIEGSDALEKLVQESGEGVENLKTDCLHTMTELNNMYVTGKDIDEVIKRLSFTISEALNIALEL